LLASHIIVKPGDIAESVVAVGDPGRATLLSQLLDDPRLVNDNRGLLVYTGEWRGRKITIATHGMGAPSAAIVFEELVKSGARRIVRLGTAGGVGSKVTPGTVVVADSASALIGGCGLGQYFNGFIPPMSPSIDLTTKLVEKIRELETVHVGPVFCSDAFYSEDERLAGKLEEMGVIAIEMETAILYALGKARGFEASSVLIVTNRIGSTEFIDKETLTRKVKGIAPAIFDSLIE